MHTTLLDLPTELIETIAALTSDPDLLALRWTSSEMCMTIDHIFVERHFTHRRHLVTRESFQALLDISRIDRLRRRLKVIELVVTNPSCSTTTPVPQEDQRAGKPDFDSNRPLQQSVWARWRPESGEELHGRVDVSLLSEALTNLKEAAVIPDLTISAHTHFSRTGYGFQQLVQYLSSTSQTRSRDEYVLLGRAPDDAGQTATMLLSSVAKAQFPVRVMSLCARKTPLHHDSLACLADGVAQLQSTLSQLKTLSLTIGCAHKMTSQDIDTLCSLVTSAPTLEVLELEFVTGCCGSRKSFVPLYVLAALRTNALTTLRLTGAVLRQQDLCAFLARHKESLRTLELRHITISPRDNFVAVFHWIHQHFSLDSLTLHWLQQGYDHINEARGRGGEYVFTGRKGVKAGLQELLQTVTFGDRPMAISKLPVQKHQAWTYVPYVNTFNNMRGLG